MILKSMYSDGWVKPISYQLNQLCRKNPNHLIQIRTSSHVLWIMGETEFLGLVSKYSNQITHGESFYLDRDFSWIILRIECFAIHALSIHDLRL